MRGGDWGGGGLQLGLGVRSIPNPGSPAHGEEVWGGTWVTPDHCGKVCVLPAPTAGPSPPVGDCPLPLGQVFRCPLHPVVPGLLFAGTLPRWPGTPRGWGMDVL